VACSCNTIVEKNLSQYWWKKLCIIILATGLAEKSRDRLHEITQEPDYSSISRDRLCHPASKAGNLKLVDKIFEHWWTEKLLAECT
jgi:hypothetical protein